MADADDHPLRVIHLSNVFQGLGGIQSALQDHLAHDPELGMDSRFIVLWEAEEKAWPHTQFLGWNVHTRISQARRSLRAALAALPPADLHVLQTEWGWPFFLDLLGDTRRVIYIHNNFPGLDKFLPTRVWAVDGAIVVSEALEEKLLQWRPDFPRDRILRAACPIDPPEAVASFCTPRIPSAPLRLGFCGRMSIEQKRVDRFPELVRQLDALGVPFRLEFLGDGDYREALEQQLPDRSRFIFHGRRSRDDVWRIMAGWDAMVFVSDYEGTPLAMLEGMAAGVLPLHPALGSGGDSVAGSLHPKLVYPAGDLAALAQAIQWLAAQDLPTIEAFQAKALRIIEPQRAGNARGKVAQFLRYIAAQPRLEKRAMAMAPALIRWLTFKQFEPVLAWTKRFRR